MLDSSLGPICCHFFKPHSLFYSTVLLSLYSNLAGEKFEAEVRRLQPGRLWVSTPCHPSLMFSSCSPSVMSASWPSCFFYKSRVVGLKCIRGSWWWSCPSLAAPPWCRSVAFGPLFSGLWWKRFWERMVMLHCTDSF